MPPKFKRHLNDDDVTGSVKSERRNLLEEDSDEEEDFFLRGPSGPKFGSKNDKIRQVQNQVDEVIDVMQENITKVIERGERLDDLQDKSESLSDNATAFSNRSKQLRRQMWWRGCKVRLIWFPKYYNCGLFDQFSLFLLPFYTLQFYLFK
ncbi:vesicle-associated membrane protein 4 isoform 1-T2 [Vipera latastei]